MNGLSRIFPGVEIGAGATLGDFLVLGALPRGASEGQFPLVIGAGAILRSHTVIYAGNRIGARLQTGHRVLIREHNTIGDDVSIGTNSVVEHHVRIGNGVRLHSNVFVPEYSILEDECWLGPNVVLTNSRYPKCPGEYDKLVGARIARGARIGANSTLLPGVAIGEYALVGAGSVVTKDVPAGKVAVGNPARIVCSLEEIPGDPYELRR